MFDNLKKIFENRHEQESKFVDLSKLMSPSQISRGQYYKEKYLQRRAELDKERLEFDQIWKLYNCERDPVDDDPNYPRNFIPLIAPVVEGQTASMMEGGIEYVYSSDNPSQQSYLPKLEAAGAYCRRLNNAENHYKDFTRHYEVLGNAWISVLWEKSYSTAKNRPDGYPRIMIPTVYSVLVDGRIKDYKDLQHAEYIIHEIGFQDIAWARREYGDELAEAISLGLSDAGGSNPDETMDDYNTFLLLHVWTRDNEQGNLQLIEMDSSGLILRESDPSEPYYKTVDNEYPFYFARMMPRLGNFYGYGDGKLLKYLQIQTNNLADELEIAARFSAQSKTYVDPKGEMDMDQYDSDPSHLIVCKSPRDNIYTAPPAGISPIILDMIIQNLQHSQRASRFSDMMTGTQQGVSATATQINGQLSQGSVGIRDKAADIQRAMAWAERYSVRLCLDNWKIPFWVGKFRNSSDADGSEFIDLSEMSKVPAVIPASGQVLLDRMELKKNNPNMKIADYESVTDEETGEPVYTDLDYNVGVKLSAGFPKGKNDLFNQIISLSQLAPPDENGVPSPIMDIEVARAKLAEIMGFKLITKKSEAVPKPVAPMNAQVNPLSASGEVAQPQGSQVRTQPSNLMGTVPMARDNRGMQL